MFPHEDRIKAVKLLIKYDMSYSEVIRELGYPSKGSLRKWYQEYKKSGDLHFEFIRKNKYSSDDKQNAVTYYIEHGKSVSRTVRKLGYPSRPILDKWIAEIAPDQKKHCLSGGAVIKCSYEKKEKAVISLCTRNNSAVKLLQSMEQHEQISTNGNVSFLKRRAYQLWILIMGKQRNPETFNQ